MKQLPIQMLVANLKKQRARENENGVVLAGLHLQIRNLENLQEKRVELMLELEEQVVEELMDTLSRMVKGNLSRYLK